MDVGSLGLAISLYKSVLVRAACQWGFRDSVFLVLLESAVRTGGDVTARQFRRSPGYCCCDNSAVFLPAGQVCRYWFQASCMLRWFAAGVEQKNVRHGFCAIP